MVLTALEAVFWCYVAALGLVRIAGIKRHLPATTWCGMLLFPCLTALLAHAVQVRSQPWHTQLWAWACALLLMRGVAPGSSASPCSQKGS